MSPQKKNNKDSDFELMVFGDILKSLKNLFKKVRKITLSYSSDLSPVQQKAIEETLLIFEQSIKDNFWVELADLECDLLSISQDDYVYRLDRFNTSTIIYTRDDEEPSKKLEDSKITVIELE